MKILRLILITALLLLLQTNTQLSAQTTDGTEEIFLAYYDAINAGDIDTAMQYISDDYVSVILPPPPGTDPVAKGTELRRSTTEFLISGNIEYDFVNIDVQDETVYFFVWSTVTSFAWRTQAQSDLRA